MRVRPQAFALMLVLIGAAGVFALAMNGSVLLRAATVETSAAVTASSDRRAAYGAASLVLRAMLRPPGDAVAGGDDAAPGEEGPRDLDEDDLELPPILREMLRQSGVDLEQEARKELLDDESVAASSDLSTNAGRRVTRPVVTPTAPLVLQIGDTPCVVRVRDGAGGVNINTADRSVLMRFARAHGLQPPEDERFADEVIDWRDADAVPGTYGAEQAAYDLLGVRVPNAPFRSLDELAYLRSMSPARAAQFRRGLTVAGTGAVHLPTAEPEAIEALGVLSPQQVRQIMQLREAGALSREAMQRVVDAAGEDAARSLRFDFSGLVRLEIDVYPVGSATSDGVEALAGLHPRSSFVAVASISGGAVRGLHVRPAGFGETSAQQHHGGAPGGTPDQEMRSSR